jgi:hypothetical protein
VLKMMSGFHLDINAAALTGSVSYSMDFMPCSLRKP